MRDLALKSNLDEIQNDHFGWNSKWSFALKQFSSFCEVKKTIAKSQQQLHFSSSLVNVEGLPSVPALFYDENAR